MSEKHFTSYKIIETPDEFQLREIDKFVNDKQFPPSYEKEDIIAVFPKSFRAARELAEHNRVYVEAQRDEIDAALEKIKGWALTDEDLKTLNG